MQSTITPSAGSRAEANSVPVDLRAGKYLIFQLGREEFGAGVLKVREIMKLQEITAVPQTPAFVKGVINLRGRVIPVIDLRMKFGLPQQDYTEHTCIVVVRAQTSEGELPMGVVVDDVVEVLTLAATEIEDTPDFGHGTATPYLLGMAKIRGKVKILLDMDQVLSRHELQGLDALLQ
jgi:purine-binding chemotaxis protein CheW